MMEVHGEEAEPRWEVCVAPADTIGEGAEDESATARGVGLGESVPTLLGDGMGVG